MPEKLTREIRSVPMLALIEISRDTGNMNVVTSIGRIAVVRVVDTHDGYLRVDRIQNGKPVSEICFKNSCDQISGISIEDG